ncbi:GGDEF domain-containing protein [Caulobacter sp. 17J80-11]|uniref:GGDEF domain-containing protein n=1 Tax=Caulobacter sp. 17J80-11 TaxID=2763502 RepID=UPI001653D1D4|nr:GGDEF domain-containing protein [Caulobacter sp. 17J80-11]MBC6980700.1 GGDEF domain-containing protein [Caulobacter sp. 17J80-11]
MTGQVEVALRGPDAFSLARKALEMMESAAVWPTPLNFELWLHYLGEPESPLAREITRMLAAGEPFTDDVSETLAAEFLPRARLSDEIRDAGAQLSRELRSVATAMATAQKTQAAYGKTLAGASQGLNDTQEPPVLRKLVEGLAAATDKVSRENSQLERRLHDSTREVTKLREHLEQVRRDAMTDALTNLANRKAFDEQLTRVCAEADEKGQPLTLAVVDIDHFKRFNDTWGHQTGDQVLRYVASVIGRVAGSPPRIAARYGGEEFGLIFPGENAAAVQSALDVVRQEIAGRSLKRRSTNEDLGQVTVSAGLAQMKKGETAASLIERADEALYASKRGGRNRVTSAERPKDAA